MSDVTPRLASVAFAGLLIWLGVTGARASAAEAATAIAPPAARLGEIDVCRILAPRFEPNAAHGAPLDAVRYAGGAKLRFLVAAPCPRANALADV